MTTAPVIAIVDDDPSVLRALHRLVQWEGYTVQSFASARAFLEASTRSRPDCLVLDVHLDLNWTGFEVQERLIAEGIDVPIIFITAHDDAGTRRRLEHSGAAAHFWKPVDSGALLHAIRRATGPDT